MLTIFCVLSFAAVYFEGTEGALEKLAPGSEAQLVEVRPSS